jgi:hypothetical protein
MAASWYRGKAVVASKANLRRSVMRIGAATIAVLVSLLGTGTAPVFDVLVRVYLYVASAEGYVTVSQPASEATCSPGVCAMVFRYSQRLVFASGVRTGSRTSFGEWTGGCSGSKSPSCVTLAGKDQSIRASFSRVRVWTDAGKGGRGAARLGLRRGHLTDAPPPERVVPSSPVGLRVRRTWHL